MTNEVVPDILNGAELGGDILDGDGPGGPQARVPHSQPCQVAPATSWWGGTIISPGV